MRETALPSPGIGGKGHHLRRIAAQAISALEIIAPKYSTGIHPEQTALARFFARCLDAAAHADTGAGLITPVPSITGNRVSVAVGATSAAPTLDKDGSAATAAWTSSNAGVATVNGTTGAVTGVAAGSAFLILSLPATATYRAFTRRFPITVTA